MAGTKALKRIQLGREAAAGTAVAASTRWRGLGSIQDNREVTFVDEEVGILSGTDRSYTGKLEGAMSFEETEATFEQIPYLFECGVKLVQTGAADGSGAGKIYTYTMPTTSLNTIRTLTIEGGDNQAAEEMEYSFVDAFTISGAGGEALKMSAEWIGRQVSTSTFTSASTATLPEVEEILFGKGYLYIDSVSGTIGTTTAGSTLLDMSLEVDTGIMAKYSADGGLYFTFHQFTEPEIMLNLTYEHNSTAVTEKAAWRAETPRQLRLLFEGSAFTAGTSYSKKTLIIDLAGKYETFDALDDKDGNSVVACSFRAKYNSTCAKFAEFVVVNTLANLP